MRRQFYCSYSFEEFAALVDRCGSKAVSNAANCNTSFEPICCFFDELGRGACLSAGIYCDF